MSCTHRRGERNSSMIGVRVHFKHVDIAATEGTDVSVRSLRRSCVILRDGRLPTVYVRRPLSVVVLCPDQGSRYESLL